ncbi:retrovirus-related pol polyprotein from transposon TNT 1-94 [Tanacetum coccineum]
MNISLNSLADVRISNLYKSKGTKIETLSNPYFFTRLYPSDSCNSSSSYNLAALTFVPAVLSSINSKNHLEVFKSHTKTRRPQPSSNTNNDRVSSASKSSCIKNNKVEVAEHHRKLLLSKNKNHMSSKCNYIKLAIRNDKSEVICAMCNQCLITSNHDVCVLNYVYNKNSHADNQNANVSNVSNKKKHKPKAKKLKKVGSKERLASSKHRKPKTCLRWSPTRRIFNLSGKLINSNVFECQFNSSKGDNACTSNPHKPKANGFHILLLLLAGTVRFRNDHVVAILGYGDLQWGYILITQVYFVEGLGHLLFLVGQFCDLDLEVAFKRNTRFIRNLEGVDLLKGNRSTNLYTINLHEMTSASHICLISRAKSTNLPKLKYHKEHLCPSCEQGKSKKSPHPPKPVPNSKHRLHLLHMDLCGPMRVESINGKRFVLVIVDDYSRYPWIHFLESKDETPEVIKTFWKIIQVLLYAQVIIIRTNNGTKFKNQVLKQYFDDVGISHQTSSVKTPQQNRKSGYILSSCIVALCYPKNDHEDIRKLGAKGDIGFFIGYSANSLYWWSTVSCSKNYYYYSSTVGSSDSNDIYNNSRQCTDTKNSSSLAANIPNTSHNVDELYPQQHVQQQDDQAKLQPEVVANNVPNDMFNGNTFVNPFAPPSTSFAESSFQYVDSSNTHTFYQPYQHDYQCTKDHPLEQVIGEPS